MDKYVIRGGREHKKKKSVKKKTESCNEPLSIAAAIAAARPRERIESPWVPAARIGPTGISCAASHRRVDAEW
jgi:hypothetical protein